MPTTLSIPLALLCAILLFPYPAAAQTAPPDPRFGIVEAYVNAQAATEAGAGYTRIILRWDVIQPGGPDDWKPANVPDPYIQGELDAGRQVVALLIGTPAWAAANPAQGARSVPRMDAWSSFVKGVAQQYRGRIHHWIIWNEPDVWAEDHPGSTWAGSEQDYKELLKTAYLSIKGVDPTMQVQLAGLTYFWDATHGRRQYLDRVLDAILADPEAPAHNYYFDTVVYHLYFNPLQAPAVIGMARQALAGRNITGKEIWINETNAPPSDDPQEVPWSTPRFRISLQDQAAFALQQVSLVFAAGAQRVEFYKLRNTPDHPESIEPFGLLRGDDSRRPAFLAYQVATTYLRDFRSARLERLGDVYAVTFDRGSQTTTVFWTMGPARRILVPATTPAGQLVDEAGQVRPVAASSGVYAIDLPGASCGQNCMIGGAPRLLVEAGEAGGRAALPIVAQTVAQEDRARQADPAPRAISWRTARSYRTAASRALDCE